MLVLANIFSVIGMKVKGYWFKIQARQLLSEMNPETSFAFSDGWFDRFKARYKISFRRSTNTSQKPASDNENCIRHFHRQIREVCVASITFIFNSCVSRLLEKDSRRDVLDSLVYIKSLMWTKHHSLFALQMVLHMMTRVLGLYGSEGVNQA